MNFRIFIIFLTLKLASGVFCSALSFAFFGLNLLGNEILNGTPRDAEYRRCTVTVYI